MPVQESTIERELTQCATGIVRYATEMVDSSVRTLSEPMGMAYTSSMEPGIKVSMFSISVGVALGIMVLLLRLLHLSSTWHRASKSGARIPEGSFGWPLIGETIDFAQSPGKYAASHYKRYGSIFKSNLFMRKGILGTTPDFARFVTANSQLFTIANPGNVGKIGEKYCFGKDGLPHLSVKRILQRAVQQETLQTRVESIETIILQNLASWERSGTVNGREATRKITLETAALVLFGVPNIGSTPEGRLASESLLIMAEGLFSLPVNFPGSKLNKALKAKAGMTTYIKSLLQERRGQVHTGTDMLANMVAAKEDPNARQEIKDLDHEAILENLLAMWFGFYETTSITLTWILKFLDNNPEVYRRVQAEHQQILNSKGQLADGPRLTWDDTKNKMTYTQKFFKELQRVMSLGAIICRRATQDVEYQGYLIPKGWAVFPMINFIHSDPDIYPDPTRFNPDRFDDTPKPHTYLPFSAGAHKCPGIEVAKLISYIFIHHLATTYTFESAAADRGTDHIPFPCPIGGYPIHIRRRNQGDLHGTMKVGQGKSVMHGAFI